MSCCNLLLVRTSAIIYRKNIFGKYTTCMNGLENFIYLRFHRSNLLLLDLFIDLLHHDIIEN